MSGDTTTTITDRRPVYALLAAEGISQLGNMMTLVAGPWFVLETTGSAAAIGLVGAALALGAIAPIFGGPLLDRLGFRRGSVVADIVSGVTVGLIPVLHLAGLLQYWQIVLLVLILAIANSQAETARLALVPAVSRIAGMPFDRVNARDRAIVQGGSVLGPLIGGLLVAAIGAVNVLFVDAATFAISALLLAVGIPRAVDAREPRAAEGGRRYLAELAEGLKFVRSRGFLLAMVLVAAVGNFFDKPLLTVIAPIYADQIYGSPASFGALVGSFGAGAFAGSLLFGSVGRSWSRRRTFLICYVVGAAVVYGTLALSPPLIVTMAAAVAAGIAFGPVNPIFATVTQENTPPEMLGRVFGALTAIAQVAIPIGAVVAGVAIQRAGLIPTIAGMGVVYVVVMISMFFNSTLRGMDEHRVSVSELTGGSAAVQSGETSMTLRTTDIR